MPASRWLCTHSVQSRSARSRYRSIIGLAIDGSARIQYRAALHAVSTELLSKQLCACQCMALHAFGTEPLCTLSVQSGSAPSHCLKYRVILYFRSTIEKTYTFGKSPIARTHTVGIGLGIQD